MKYVYACFFTFFMIASLRAVATARDKISNVEPLTIRLDLIMLEETTTKTTPTDPTTPIK